MSPQQTSRDFLTAQPQRLFCRNRDFWLVDMASGKSTELSFSQAAEFYSHLQQALRAHLALSKPTNTLNEVM
ncbi:MAG: hypothetical protein ACRCYV_08780 [Aeromonas sp.]